MNSTPNPGPATDTAPGVDGMAEEGQGRLLAPGLAPTPSSAVSLGYRDTGRKTGVPTPTDPITGLRKRPNLRTFARERGWEYRFKGTEEVYTKGTRSLWVARYRGTIIDGSIHESPNHGGMLVKKESLLDILDGVRCACDSFGISGQDCRPNPTCPISHPPRDYTHLDNGFDPRKPF